MPPGTQPSWTEALPPPGDSASWSEADWHWDPVAMTATALMPGGKATSARMAAAGHASVPAAGCSAAAGKLDAYVRGLLQASSSADEASQGGSRTAAAPPAAANASNAGTAASGAAAAAAAAPTRARGKPRKAGAGGPPAGPCVCQADGCGADLSGHTYYHQRNKICAVHIKADVFLRDGQELRFCQRCGHAHPLDEFDAGKHSCRKQLEKHNARRRKRQQQGAEGGVAGPAAPVQQVAQAGGQRAKRSRGKAASAAAASLAAAAGGGSAAPPARAAAASPAGAQPAQLAAQQAPRSTLDATAPAVQPSASTSCSPSTSAAGGLPPPTAAAAQHPPQAVQHAGAAAPPLLEPSPSLSLLDFDLDSLEPTPYHEVFPAAKAAPLHSATGSDLADELAAWLNSNLAEEDSAAPAAAPAPGLHSLPPLPPLPQHGWHTAAAAAPAGWLPLQPQMSSSLQYGQAIMQQQLLPVDTLLHGQAPPPLMHQPWAQQPGGPVPTQAAPPVALGVPVAVPQAASHPLAVHAQLEAMQQGQQQALGRQPSLSPGDAAPASSMTRAPTGGSAGAPAASAATGSGPPPPTLSTVSVKLFGCTPAELPQGLREHLRTWFDGAVHSLDGYLRPGCVHLTVQALLDGMLEAAQGRSAAQEGRGQEPLQSQQHGGEQHGGLVHAPAPAAPAASALEAAAAAEEAQQGQKACCRKQAAPTPALPAAQAASGAPRAQPAAAGASGAPAAGACCGRKRPAEGPADPRGGADGAVRRVVDRMMRSGEALWRTKTMLVQAGSHVALVHRGRLQKTWDIEGSPSARAVPAILEVSPPLLLASQPEQLRVTGLNMLQNDCQLLLRLQGRYVQPAAAHCGDCCCAASVHPASGAGPAGQLAAAAAASSFEQRCCGCCTDKLQLVGLLPRPFPAATDAAVSAGAPGGAAAIEPPSCCQARTPAGAAAPDAAPPCCQAQQATTQQQPEQQQQAAVGSAGRRLLAGAARMQSLRLQLPSQAQQEAAGQQALPPGLLHLDIARRAYMAPRGARVLVVSSPAVHRELVLLLRTQGPTALPPPLLDQLGVVMEWLGQPAKMQYQLVEATAARLLFWATARGLPATAGLLLSVLQAQGGSSAAAAAGVLQGALPPGQLDSLAQLHLSAQLTSAAAMQRAAELACRDGLSLLHRAVQSGSTAMLAAVLGWGEEAGSPWRCDLAGPMGLSPLHLAALLPSAPAARQAVLLLLGRCAPGARAWDCCCAADGQSPAGFFRAVAGAAAADALGTEVAVLLQLQERQEQQQVSAGRPPLPAPVKVPASKQQAQQAQQHVQEQKPAAREASPAAGLAAAAAAAAATAQPLEMQPGTPRRNAACLCAPGCPCAMLDRCACCGESSDEDEEERGGSAAAHGTCGAGSGKCCCCSGIESNLRAGCVGCEAGGEGAAACRPTPADGAAGGGCCGGRPAPAAAPSCCGRK